MSFNEDYKRNEVSLFQLKNILTNFLKRFHDRLFPLKMLQQSL